MKFLYRKDVKIAKVKQIEKHSIKSILKWGHDHTSIDYHLPSYDYGKYPNRDWIWNLLNSIAHHEFKNWLKMHLKIHLKIERKLNNEKKN